MGIKGELSIKIAGEIVLSKEPSKAIRKWREIFEVTQSSLADSLGISASVISDYESGRRKSPGAGMIKKVVDALIESDEEKGSQVLRAYERIGGAKTNAILDMQEFTSPIKAREVCRIVKGTAIANEKLLSKNIYGYTAVDSPKAILELDSDGFLKLYGSTSERALVFTRVSSGRSPFVAIRVSSIKPGLVVLHGLRSVDALGIKIAEKEKIPVVLSKIESVDELIRELRRGTS
ncbi:MAG: helix-turn-helix domain-containing protein [Methanobacteriota archaeon]